MLSRENKEQIKHISKALEKEIKIKEEEIQKLRKMTSRLFHYLYDQESFDCPLKLSNYDAICPGCTEILPEIVTGWIRKGLGSANFYGFPYGTKEETIAKVKFKTEGCKEWVKKEHGGACGCGGIMWCECGYKEEYCWSDKETCPYCGRGLQHKKYKQIGGDLTQLLSEVKVK